MRGRRGPVHPRVCGEQEPPHPRRGEIHGPSPRVRGTDDPARSVMLGAGGPSPRVRGTAGGGRTDPVSTRSIPACAGNSRGCLRGCLGGCGPSPRVRGTGQVFTGFCPDSEVVSPPG